MTCMLQFYRAVEENGRLRLVARLLTGFSAALQRLPQLQQSLNPTEKRGS
jgi:hypothetical protein